MIGISQRRKETRRKKNTHIIYLNLLYLKSISNVSCTSTVSQRHKFYLDEDGILVEDLGRNAISGRESTPMRNSTNDGNNRK